MDNAVIKYQTVVQHINVHPIKFDAPMEVAVQIYYYVQHLLHVIIKDSDVQMGLVRQKLGIVLHSFHVVELEVIVVLMVPVLVL